MKLTKNTKQKLIPLLVILGLILLSSLIQLATCGKNSSGRKSQKSKSSKKTANKGKFGGDGFEVFRDNYYNFCARIKDAGYVMKDDCSTVDVQDKFQFPCDGNAENGLKNKKGVANTKLEKKTDLPTSTLFDLTQKSTCKNPWALFNNINNGLLNPDLKFTDPSFEVKTALVRDYEGMDRSTKFYENSKEVLISNPQAQYISYNMIIKQLNKGFQLLNKHRFAKNPIKLLDENKDLVMENAALYLTEFVGVAVAYHQLIYVCAKDSTGRALHFLVDRGARSLAVGTLMKTRIRIILYHISNQCGNAKDMPDDPQFNFNFKVARQGLNQHNKLHELKQFLDDSNKKGIYKPENPVGHKIAKGYTSFDKFSYAVQKYVRSFWNYDLWDNCQHFSTGFYNVITNNKLEHPNKDHMERVPFKGATKNSFPDFFIKSKKLKRRRMK